MSFDFTVRTRQDLMDAVERFGFVPLFRNSIPGFSVEEHVAPSAWFDSGQDGVWEWKGPVIRELSCAYGKFFERKAAFVRRDWFCDLANYRRDGYDFDARFDDGLASWSDKYLYDLADANAPVISRALKRLGDYRKGGRKGFDTAMNRLQEQGYIVISDFVYEQDRYGAVRLGRGGILDAGKIPRRRVHGARLRPGAGGVVRQDPGASARPAAARRRGRAAKAAEIGG